MSKSSPTRRTRKAALATIAALALPISGVAAATTSAHADPFEGGKKVPKSSFTQDGAITGATGSQALIDGTGVKYFANSNITFSTTSSASGAMSEASFTAAQNVTTLNGGTTVSTLKDAFDGYNTLATFVGSAGAPTGTIGTGGVAQIFNKTGADPTTSCGGRQVDYPTQANGVVDVTRSIYVPDGAGQNFARWVNTVKNNGATPTEVHLYVANNLGSDSNTTIFDSSSGDTTGDTSDTWVGTFQNYSGTTSSDPRLGHVLRGPSDTTITQANFANGDDNPFWNYTVQLAAGQSKSIVNYVVPAASKALAASRAADLAQHPNFTCLSTDQIAQVANFDVTGPTVTVPANISAKATSAAGAVVTYATSATDAVDGSRPVTCTPPSGSTFPVGTTTVTCKSTDASGNTTTKTFTVTVAAFTKVKISKLKIAPRFVPAGGKAVVTFKLNEAAGVTLKFMTRDRKPVFLHVKGKKGSNKVVFDDTVSGTQLSHRYYLLIVKAHTPGGGKDQTKMGFRFED